MGKAFDFLKTTNDWLETVPGNMNRAFENFIGTGEKITQSKVDVICTWLAWKVNIAVERKRQTIIKILYGMYKNTVGGKVMQMAMAIKSFVSDPLGALGSFASNLFSPFTSVVEWAKMLMEEIPRLAENLANIAASLPPEPPNAHINYDKFKVKVGTISMAMITSDPENLPAPEVLFPEPEKPFSKNTFDIAFEDSAKLKSSQIRYVLSEDAKNSLASVVKATTNVEFDDTAIS